MKHISIALVMLTIGVPARAEDCKLADHYTLRHRMPAVISVAPTLTVEGSCEAFLAEHGRTIDAVVAERLCAPPADLLAGGLADLLRGLGSVVQRDLETAGVAVTNVFMGDTRFRQPGTNGPCP